MATADETHYAIIERPLVTEKSASKFEDNVYTFLVHPKANKLQIKAAVEAIWNVRVASVRTINVKGEERRNMMGKFTTKGKRKAYVKLMPGYEIEVV